MSQIIHSLENTGSITPHMLDAPILQRPFGQENSTLIAEDDPVWDDIMKNAIHHIEDVLRLTGVFVYTCEMLTLNVYVNYPEVFRLALHDQLVAVYDRIMTVLCTWTLSFPSYLQPLIFWDTVSMIDPRGIIGAVEYDRGIRRAYFSHKDVASSFKLIVP